MPFTSPLSHWRNPELQDRALDASAAQPLATAVADQPGANHTAPPASPPLHARMTRGEHVAAIVAAITTLAIAWWLR